MELIIGRDSGSSRLRIGINNQDKFYGNSGSVPQSVSRQHCKLIIEENNKWIITNIKSENVTYVNGLQVESKRITPQDRIELGNDRYLLNINAILAGLGQAIPQTFNIRHLKKVWDTFHDTKLEIQIKEKKSVAIRSVTGIFSMSAVACSFIPGIADISSLRIVLYASALILTAYFFIITYRASSNLPLFMDRLDKKFHDDYVCPNPQCHHFMGYQQYNDIKKTGSCPYCKAKLTEE